MVYRIVYTSLAVGLLDDEELSSLCEQSTDRNLKDEITGIFLYDGSRFLQAIEGEQAAVERLMKRISNDPRHAEIVYIQREAVPHREFSCWSMEEPLAYGTDPRKFVDQVKSDVVQVRSPSLRAQIIGFARMAAASRAIISPPSPRGQAEEPSV